MHRRIQKQQRFSNFGTKNRTRFLPSTGTTVLCPTQWVQINLIGARKVSVCGTGL
jgi:hypothetical protein